MVTPESKLLQFCDEARIKAGKIDRAVKSSTGQFFTPMGIAQFVAVVSALVDRSRETTFFWQHAPMSNAESNVSRRVQRRNRPEGGCLPPKNWS